ncbi:FecR domain-containing protein [Opitutales bacterium]|nr:FecR domain-containing protein [Opitutales bacterium]
MKSYIRNMSNTIKLGTAIFMFLVLFVVHLEAQSEKKSSKGAVIVADYKEPVRFLDQAGQNIDFGNELRGSIITEGQTAQVGIGGKLVLLFSNGTITTLQSQTKMKIGVFEQVPFDAGDKKMADLEGEPSESKVVIDLDWGSLVVKTKKLDKKSSFDINSPIGTAGIRGTEFQMSQNPGTGVQLDVTESTVAFTPPGGVPTPVSQGNGLDVSSAGVSTPRPVNPAVAQNIGATNQAATQSTNDISLGTVSEAMSEATATVEDAGSGGSDSTEDGTNDSSDSGESSDGQNESKSTEQEKSGSGDGKGNDSSSSEGKGPSRGQNNRSSSNIQTQALENNSEVKEVRKTGRVSAYSRALSRYGLTTRQTNRFNLFPPQLQSRLMSLGVDNLKRVLNINDFQIDQAYSLFGYSSGTQKLILGLEDKALVSLLNQKISESVLVDTLNPENMVASSSTLVPGENAIPVQDASLLALGEKLKQSGNSDLLDELKVLSGGSMSEEWIRVGEVANVLSQDYSLSTSSLSDVANSGKEVLSNPFYQEISSLYGQLETESLVAGQPTFVGGRRITIDSAKLDISSLTGSGSGSFVVSGSELLKLSTSVELIDSPTSSTRVVLMSGENLESEKGLTFKSATRDLVLAARKDILLEDVQLESTREIALRSLRDVTLTNVTMGSGNLATVRATRDLNVNGMKFSREIPSIIMEATTIRLSEVNFPAASMVRLNSLKGAIDGKYPNFGSSIPNAQQIGRVNFIKNVSSGGNVLNTRSAFDQHGGNISIGKVALP